MREKREDRLFYIKSFFDSFLGIKSGQNAKKVYLYLCDKVIQLNEIENISPDEDGGRKKQRDEIFNNVAPCDKSSEDLNNEKLPDSNSPFSLPQNVLNVLLPYLDEMLEKITNTDEEISVMVDSPEVKENVEIVMDNQSFLLKESVENGIDEEDKSNAGKVAEIMSYAGKEQQRPEPNERAIIRDFIDNFLGMKSGQNVKTVYLDLADAEEEENPPNGHVSEEGEFGHSPAQTSNQSLADQFSEENTQNDVFIGYESGQEENTIHSDSLDTFEENLAVKELSGEYLVIRNFMDSFLGMKSGPAETIFLDLANSQPEIKGDDNSVKKNQMVNICSDPAVLKAVFSVVPENETVEEGESRKETSDLRAIPGNLLQDKRNIVEPTEEKTTNPPEGKTINCLDYAGTIKPISIKNGLAAPARAVERPEDLFENLIHKKLREPGPDEDWDDPKPIQLYLHPETMQYVVVETEAPPEVEEEKSNKGMKKKKKKNKKQKKKRVEEEVFPDVLQEEIRDAVSNVVISLMASGELQVTKTIFPVPAGPQNISGKKITLEEAPVEVSDMNKEPAAAVEQQENPTDKDPILVAVAEKLLKLFDDQVKQPSAEKLPDVQRKAEQKIVPVAEEKVPDEAQTKKMKKKNKKEKEQIPKAEVGRNKENLRKEKEKVLEEQGHAIDITAHFYKFNFEEGVEKVSHFPLNQKEKEADEWECPAPVSLHYVPKEKKFLDLEKNLKYKKEEPEKKVQTLAEETNSKKIKPYKKKYVPNSEKLIVKLPLNVLDSKREEKSVVESVQPDPIVVLKPIEGPFAQGEFSEKKDKNVPRNEVVIPEETKSVEKPAPAQLPPESVVKRVQPAPIVENKVFKPAIEGSSAQGEFRAPEEQKKDVNDTVNLENIPRNPVLFSEKVKSVRQPPPGPSAQGEFRAPVEQKKDKNDTDKIKIIPEKVQIPEKIISAEKPSPVLFPSESVVESARPDPIVIEKEVVQPAIERPPAQGGSRAPAEQKMDKNKRVRFELTPRKVRVPEKTKSVEKPAPAQLPPKSVLKRVQPAPIVENKVFNSAIEGPPAQGECRAPEEQKRDINDTVNFENIPGNEVPIPEKIKPPAVQFPPEPSDESFQYENLAGVWTALRALGESQILLKSTLEERFTLLEKSIDGLSYEVRLSKAMPVFKKPNRLPLLTLQAVANVEALFKIRKTMELEQYKEICSYLKLVMNATQSWQAAVDAVLEAFYSTKLLETKYYKNIPCNFEPQKCPSIEEGLYELLQTHCNAKEMTMNDFKKRVQEWCIKKKNIHLIQLNEIENISPDENRGRKKQRDEIFGNPVAPCDKSSEDLNNEKLPDSISPFSLPQNVLNVLLPYLDEMLEKITNTDEEISVMVDSPEVKENVENVMDNQSFLPKESVENGTEEDILNAGKVAEIMSYAGKEQQQPEPNERAIIRDFIDNFLGMKSGQNVETVHLDLAEDAEEEENPPNGHVSEEGEFGHSPAQTSNQSLADQFSEENTQNDVFLGMESGQEENTIHSDSLDTFEENLAVKELSGEYLVIRNFMDSFLGIKSGPAETIFLDLANSQPEIKGDAHSVKKNQMVNICSDPAVLKAVFTIVPEDETGESRRETSDLQSIPDNLLQDKRNIVEQTEEKTTNPPEGKTINSLNYEGTIKPISIKNSLAAPARAVERPEDLFENLIHKKLREPGPDEDWDDPKPIQLYLHPETMQYVVDETETAPKVQEEESNKGKKKKKKKKKKRVEEEEVSPDVLQEEFGDAVSNVLISLMASGELQVTKTIAPVPAGPQNISGKKIIFEEEPVEVSDIEGQETIKKIVENQDISPPNVLLDNPQDEPAAAAVEQQENPIDKDPILVEVAEKLFDEQVKESSAEKLPDVQTEQKIVPVAEEKVPNEAQTKKGKKKNKNKKEQIPKVEVGKNKENLRKEKEKVLEEQGHAIDITAHFYKFNFEEGVEKVSHFPLNQKEKEADEWECPAPVSLHYVPKVKRFLDLEEHQKNKKVEIIEEVVEEPKILPDVTNSKKNEPEKKKSPSESEKSIVKLPMNVVDSKKEEKSVVVQILKRPIEGPPSQGEFRVPEEQKRDIKDTLNFENIPGIEVPIPEKIKPPTVQFPPEPSDESFQYEDLADVWTALRNLGEGEKNLKSTIEDRFGRLEKSIADLRREFKHCKELKVTKKPKSFPLSTVEDVTSVEAYFDYLDSEIYKEMHSYLELVMNATQSWQAAVDAVLEAMFTPALQKTELWKKEICISLPKVCPSIEKGLYDLLTTHRNGDEMTREAFQNRVQTWCRNKPNEQD
ncbi:Hypothetical predicted protein [Cloeon dipterum]|uniref:Uncharacterized protein n=1 Tax=Cloeon dipterum TaxID=197152 RepID=A0A8S1BXL0_9INSE|nr:Hypothetical predicted protein [Cloeon dipterum]